MKRWLWIGFALAVVVGLAGFSWLWFAPCALGGCAPVSELGKLQAEGSLLLDARGEPLGTLATVDRRVVSLDSLPPYLPQAVLAIEDQRFYDHGGVDWQRSVGALFANLRAGGVREGGSTITMQLARNLFPDRLSYRDRTLRRKVAEVRVARQLERAFPKDRILELYLNEIYLGEGAYGVEAAARSYFGKSASELTLAEAATLAALPKAPSEINPRADREAALERRNLVLREMAEAGYLTPAEAEAAIAEPLRLAERAEEADDPLASYFAAQVRRELEAAVGERFYTAGLTIHTTLDPEIQEAAEAGVAEQLEAIEAGRFGAYRHPTYPEARGEAEDGATPYLQGMALVMDAETGAVRALVGGRDYADSKFDRAFQARRQPGSAFKPFVYLAALEHSVPPSRRIDDAPVRIALAGGGEWKPENYTGRYDGPVTVRDALVRSKNTVAVRLAQEVGIPAVVRTARELGITGEIPSVPATALGAASVRPVELAAAYAAFANGGDRVEPHLVERVENRWGETIYEAPRPRRRVVDPAAAFVLTSLLRDVVDRGTGAAVRSAGFRGPAAGKTGTTNDATDVWFVGYTPELVGAVWFGFDRPQTIVRGASGGTLAAPVWGRIMSRVYRSRPLPAEWTPPPGVVTATVERGTGEVVDERCPARGETHTEYFVRVRPPRQPCAPPGAAVYAVDRGWYDEEWGGFDPDTVGLSRAPEDLRARGIEWPELEARRRRGDTLRAPLPGRVAPPPVSLPEPEPVRPRPRAPEPPPPAGDDGPELLGRPVERSAEPKVPPGVEPPAPEPAAADSTLAPAA